ncbi:MAG TPA: class I SAM-dependent methyltransferase, partial [Acidimicrobiales bacterium]|nr:class I SAM-dependent methyltransferase [Acidimicrobiales bacterium]
TLLAASLGLDAVGVDLAAAAIAAAEAKAAERGSTARFAVHDVLALDRLGSDHPHLAGGYDTVIDSGVFHVFDDADRARYVRSLATVVNPGGHYLMAVFSDRQPGDWGPRRVTEAEIRSSFSDGWTIESLLPAVFSITIDPAGAQAWVGVIRRH